MEPLESLIQCGSAASMLLVWWYVHRQKAQQQELRDYQRETEFQGWKIESELIDLREHYGVYRRDSRLLERPEAWPCSYCGSLNCHASTNSSRCESCGASR